MYFRTLFDFKSKSSGPGVEKLKPPPEFSGGLLFKLFKLKLLKKKKKRIFFKMFFQNKKTNNNKMSAWLPACVPERAGVWECGCGGVLVRMCRHFFFFHKKSKEKLLDQMFFVFLVLFFTKTNN